MTERIECELSPEGYGLANGSFLKTWSGDHDELLAFLRDTYKDGGEEVPLPDVSILSIGAGDGSRDVQAIKTLQEAHSNAKFSYTALEPNSELLAKLQEAVAKDLPDVSLTTISTKAEDYDMPQNKFDVILFTHSLYHMPGQEMNLLKSAIDALRADRPSSSRIIVALSTEKGGIFQMMGSFWHKIDYSRFETGGGLFGQESLLKILTSSFDKNYRFLPLPDVYIDVGSCFDDADTTGKHLLNFIMQSDVERLPNDLKKEILAKLLEISTKNETDGSIRLPHGSGLAVIYRG